MEEDIKNIKKELIGSLLEKDILLNQELFTLINEVQSAALLNQLKEETASLQNSQILDYLKKRLEAPKMFVQETEEEKSDKQEILKETKVDVLFSYNTPPKKRSVGDFVAYFNRRFSVLERFLRERQPLSSPTSINRILSKSERETVSIIGMVKEIQRTKNKNIIMVIEDTTGEIKVLFSVNKPELINLAKDTVFDEVVGVRGVTGDKIVFAQELIRPDLPRATFLKKSPDECYAIFLSDIHIGSTYFLEEKFDKFLKWLNSEAGTEEQKTLVSKIRYLFIVGDLVDGVGIYPNQDEELVIKDISAQYEEFVRLLKKVPQHIEIIICPGNHDATRLSEPQPEFGEDFTSSLKELPNTTLVSNPSIINIHKSEGFSGFNVLLYHGYSFDYYVANVDSIRQSGGYNRPDLIMKFLLQRRHLAPSHTSSLYIPDAQKDNLVIESVPDIFVTGHIHKSSVANYRNVTMICGSCWQSTTDFQKKVGHNPEPARVPLINLQTRKARILRF